MSANDPDEFVRREIDWISVPLREQRPFLGICLGAQMLAMQLGARVAPHPEGRAEIGYYPIRPTPAGLALCPHWPDHVYHWHREGFELPRGAELLAEGGDFPIQAFQIGSRLRLPVSSRRDLRDDASLDHARPRAPGIAGRAAAPPSLRRSRDPRRGRARLAEGVSRRLAGADAAVGDVGSRGIAREKQRRDIPRGGSRSLSKSADVLVSARKLASNDQRARGGDMTGDEFARLLSDFTLSAESGDGARFASHFTEDAIYYDYIYGPHHGRADIAHMMQDLFHRDAADYRWEMFDPVFDGTSAMPGRCRASPRRSRSSRASAVVIDGMSRFIAARRPDRRIPRIRQWRRGDGAARRRAGPHDQGVQALDRLARGAAGNHRLSGAAERLARTRALKHMNQQQHAAAKDTAKTGRSGGLSAHPLRRRATRSRPSR